MFDKVADGMIIDFGLGPLADGIQDLYIVVDVEGIRKKALDSSIIGKLASKATGASSFLDSAGSGEGSSLCREIDASFNSVTFENTISKILFLLNLRLDELKAKDSRGYMATMKDMLVAC